MTTTSEIDELTFEQQQEIDRLGKLAFTPSSNSNKSRFELYAHIESLITADRKRVALEARENTSKLYESELDMHRKFMDSVIANNQLKTTVMYCNKCGVELFNLKERPDDTRPE